MVLDIIFSLGWVQVTFQWVLFLFAKNLFTTRTHFNYVQNQWFLKSHYAQAKCIEYLKKYNYTLGKYIHFSIK